MFKIQEIREIIKLVDASSIDEFVYEAEGSKVKLKKNNGVVTQVVVPKVEVPQSVVQQSVSPKEEAPVAQPITKEEAPTSKVEVEVDANLHKILSPMVGTFYAAPNPESPAFVQAGDQVNGESIVCIVEAMKLFNEIEAEIDGEVVEVLVKDGQLVEYGQPLFLVKA